MLLVFPYCAKDREQAASLVEWINELGPYPAHELLMVREQKAAPIPFGLGAKGFNKVRGITVRDPDNKWPKSAGLMFRSAAKQIQYTTNEPFFWIEPDAIPMREGWLDEIAAEYESALNAGKHFLADLIDHRSAGTNFVLHASGICVYPKDLVHRAGEIFHAYDDIPFDIAAGPAIHSQAKQSELIFHCWNREGQGLAPFKDWSDIEAKIFARRPKCALFHSDKSGTLLGLLRERKNFSGGVSTVVSAGRESKSLEVAKGRTSDLTLREDSAPPAENNLPDGVACSEPGCLSHISHPCEGCGRIGGRSAEPTFQPESPAEIPLGPLDTNCPALTLRPITDLSQISSGHLEASWHDQTPWENKDASLIEIRRIAARLRQFQTNFAYVRYVRQLLAEAGVIQLAKKKRWRKKKK